jgi:hypothetical protein
VITSIPFGHHMAMGNPLEVLGFNREPENWWFPLPCLITGGYVQGMIAAMHMPAARSGFLPDYPWFAKIIRMSRAQTYWMLLQDGAAPVIKVGL